jgi:hypothetical protein
MIEDSLLQYGMAGLFIAYLIFDRQYLMKDFKDTIKENTRVIRELCNRIERR